MNSTIKISTITNIDKPEYKYVFKHTGDFRRRFKMIQYAINKFQTKPQRCFEKLNNAFIELNSDWKKWYVCDSVNCKTEDADSVLYYKVLSIGTLNEGYLKGAIVPIQLINNMTDNSLNLIPQHNIINSSRSVSTQTTDNVETDETF